MFEGILCSEYNKGGREIKGLVSDGYFFFLHSLEESRLHFGWSTVDLVSEEDTCEYRSLAYLEVSFCLAIYLVPSQIRWEEIRSEAHSTRIESEYCGKYTNRFGFAKTRYSLEKSMSSGKECDNEPIDEIILSDDILLYI